MALYQNYFPATYQPYAPYQFAPQPVQQAQQNTSSILWVRNSQEAAMYPVAPNNAVALWDSSSPAIYLKKADASGKPSMQTFDLVERVEKQEDSGVEPEAKDTYATKTEMAALVNLVNAVEGKVNNLKEDISILKRTVREDDDYV